VSGEALQKLVAEFWELLTAVELAEDDREAIEADLGMGEDEVC
jgi:hypothetical protein